MQLELRIPYISSLSLSRNAKLWLGLLAGLSVSILAAGYLLNRRRRRYRAISTTSSDGGGGGSGKMVQRMSTFRGNSTTDPPSTPFHSLNSAHSEPRLRRLEKEPRVSPTESDSSHYSSAGEELAFLSARDEEGEPSTEDLTTLTTLPPSSSLPASVETDGGLASSLLPRQQQQQQQEAKAAIASSELAVVHEEEEEESRGYDSDSSSASFHSTLTSPPLTLAPPPPPPPPPAAHELLDRNHLYNKAMEIVKDGGVKCRNIRTKMLCCTSDEDFLAKLVCVRLAFDDLLASPKRDYIVQLCREFMGSFITKTGQDPNPFYECYDDIAEFLSDEDNKLVAKAELTKRKVMSMNVYDIALDYILLDAFDDMDSPPSTVLAVLQNRWITDGMKKGALSAAIWSILKAKNSILRNKNGFMTRFYTLSQVLSPMLAWGFMGTDMELKEKCMVFKGGIMELVCGMFSLEQARFTTVETLSEDIFLLAQETAAKMTNDDHVYS